ncbi:MULTISPECIES: ABC transporter permease [Anaerotruncus]|uniref:ABC transporter permease n=1 Tax=Anaerotruncus TaxID=244127 RepID=UPI001A9A6826|nr:MULTISPECIES: ABC transporter permease [Anaerotruncus]MCQ4894881.1 ABC transporter permease [Anaerotruncus sp. DFI.9.16]GKH47432.1 sugar ABC transporter permease [Oscillospiraceae bacterium]
MKESKLREMSRRALSSNLLGLFVVLILMCVVFTILKPGFLTGKNLLNILTAASLSGLIAIGESYLIIAGQIDLSPGAIAAFAGVFSALLAQRGMPILLIILITVAVGALFGAVSAFQVNALKIQPFIATLAVMSIARGLAYIICAGKPVFISHNTYIKIGITRILGIPLPVIILVVMFLVWGVALSKTRFGRNVYAVGGNPAAARLAGINADAVKRGLFILSSCLASLGGIILASRMNTGQPGAASDVDFDAITASVLGGIAMTGGTGSLSGTFLGVLILQGFNNGLLLLNVSTFWQDVARGLLMMFALTFDFYRKQRREG